VKDSIFSDAFDSSASPASEGLDGETATYTGVTVLQEREKSILVRFPRNPKPHWVARSQSRVDGDTIEVTQWLVDKWGEDGFDPAEPSPDDSVTIPGCLCLSVCVRPPPPSGSRCPAMTGCGSRRVS
jgi:hypothetical protein